jgi:hypothetical protein
MTLGIRKIIVISLIGLVFLAANILVIANWLSERGVDQKANYIKENFLTGTTIAITVILLILLVGPKSSGSGVFGLGKKCPVCDRKLIGKGDYCSQCGSKF